MKPLSQKLAELSVQTKTAEERVAKALTETREQAELQRERVRDEAQLALGKLRQRFDDAKGETRTRLGALQAKVNADVDQMTKDASEAKRKFESWQSENYANDKEADALAAIDYAMAAAIIAELQTLDAIAARARADAMAEQKETSPAVA